MRSQNRGPAGARLSDFGGKRGMGPGHQALAEAPGQGEGVRSVFTGRSDSLGSAKPYRNARQQDAPSPGLGGVSGSFRGGASYGWGEGGEASRATRVGGRGRRSRG